MLSDKEFLATFFAFLGIEKTTSIKNQESDMNHESTGWIPLVHIPKRGFSSDPPIVVPPSMGLVYLPT